MAIVPVISRSLCKRAEYVGFMLFGFGTMLATLATSVSNDAAPAARGSAVFFLGVSLLLLLIACGAKLFGMIAPDPMQSAGISNKEKSRATERSVSPAMPAAEENGSSSVEAALSDTEWGLIKLLRHNDVPPDTIAASIREALERKAH